jgi:hypothetical protein
MEVEDAKRSRQVVRTSEHPIDAEHLEMMQQALSDPIEMELVLDLSVEA